MHIVVINVVTLLGDVSGVYAEYLFYTIIKEDVEEGKNIM